jgi:hypothetical protein
MQTPGIMLEDRIAILEEARQLAVAGIQRFQFSPYLFAAYCDVGLAIYTLSGNVTVFDDAMVELRAAETRIGDPIVSSMIREYDNRFVAHLTDHGGVDEEDGEISE